nr:DNA/RNA non-specific endonuclease [Acetobacter cerevisiae]
MFFAGESPTLEGEFGHGRVLCNTAYAVMDSPVTKGPIWSAEYIVEENLEVAARTKREGYFYPDARLPAGYRGELADWKHSGWDRGHLSPSGDFAGLAAQQESYALSNVVPQAPGLNRGAWEGIEAAVRGLANAEGELYVVTGVLFSHHRVSVGPDRVMIPSGMWKAVYDPIAEGAAVYVCANTNQPDCKIVSLEVLSRWAGIDVFPSLAVSIKQHIMPMPAIEESPYAASVRTEQSRANGFSWNDRRVKEVLRLLQKALGR